MEDVTGSWRGKVSAYSPPFRGAAEGCWISLMTGLLVTARTLAEANPRRPTQANLSRAVSTAYSAVFHMLAKQCADAFAGTGAGRSERAWNQVYRALEHGAAKNA